MYGKAVKLAIDADQRTGRHVVIREKARSLKLHTGKARLGGLGILHKSLLHLKNGNYRVINGDGSTIGQILSSEATTSGAVEVRGEGNTEPSIGINYGSLVDTEFRAIYLNID